MKISVIVGIALFVMLPLYGAMDQYQEYKMINTEKIKHHLNNQGLKEFVEKGHLAEKIEGEEEVTAHRLVWELARAWDEYLKATLQANIPKEAMPLVNLIVGMNLVVCLGDLLKGCPPEHIQQLREVICTRIVQ